MQLPYPRRLAHLLSVRLSTKATTPAVARLKTGAGFALVESMVSMMLVSVLLSCAFTTDAQVLRILKRGKESSHATQMLQERVEQLRTSLWDEVIDPAKLAILATPATATSVNLPGATETIKVEPLVNATNVYASCQRSPSGTVTSGGTLLTNERSVKVTMSVEWTSHGRVRSRGMVTILTNGGI